MSVDLVYKLGGDASQKSTPTVSATALVISLLTGRSSRPADLARLMTACADGYGVGDTSQPAERTAPVPRARRLRVSGDARLCAHRDNR